MMFLMYLAVDIFAQNDGGVILDIQEIDIDNLKLSGIKGSEAVVMVLDQFTDQSYRYVFISKNYEMKEEQKKIVNNSDRKFTVGLVCYPENNNLLYVQVIYKNNFFVVAVAKRENDIKIIEGAQLIRMNYEKKNKVRMDNLKETIQKNNIVPLGIEGR